MKKLIAILIAVLTVFLCACNKAQNDETTSGEFDTTVPAEITTVESLTLEQLEPARVITVYFSHNDAVEGTAKYISEVTESELLRVETIASYPEDEAELLKTAAEEHRDNVRPGLKNAPANLREYDIIFICFPEWDSTMPMAMFTFIEDYDMRDKIVIPVINGSEKGLQNATRDINLLVPGMLVAGGYCLKSDIVSEKSQFDLWLNTTLYG